MHITYIPQGTDYWVEFYKDTITNQKQYQIGGELPGFRAFAPYHRGSGLGSFFRSLFRMALPMLKSVGKEALFAGSKIASDVAQGQSVSDSVKQHGKVAAGKMLRNVADKISGPQTGTGLGCRETYKRKNATLSRSVGENSSSQAVSSDVFAAIESKKRKKRNNNRRNKK